MEIPMGSGIPIGPRGGTHRDRGSNIPNPAAPLVPRYSRWFVLKHRGAFSEPTLIGGGT